MTKYMPLLKKDEDASIMRAPVPHEMPPAAVAGDFQDPTGKYTSRFPGAFSAVEVVVQKEDGPVSFKANAGVMVSMSDNVDFLSQLEGGLGGACFRSICTGASAFFMHFHIKPELPPGTLGDVLLAPHLPGEVILLDVESPQDWLLAKDSFLACDEDVTVDVATQNCLQGCCSGQGFFILRASGHGRLLLSTYGSIVKYVLGPGEVRKIDHGYLVAWSSDMRYTIGKGSRSLTSSFLLSGEGFVTKFTGPGVLYMQSRNLENLRAVMPRPGAE